MRAPRERGRPRRGRRRREEPRTSEKRPTRKRTRSAEAAESKPKRERKRNTDTAEGRNPHRAAEQSAPDRDDERVTGLGDHVPAFLSDPLPALRPGAER